MGDGKARAGMSAQQQAGGCGRAGSECEPARSRLPDALEHAHRGGERTRAQSFLERPEHVARAAGLGDEQTVGSKTELGEARPVRPAELASEPRSRDPEQRALPGRVAACGERDQKSGGGRSVAIIAGLQLMQAARVELSARQGGIERVQAEIPRLMCRRKARRRAQKRTGRGGPSGARRGERCRMLLSCTRNDGLNEGSQLIDTSLPRPLSACHPRSWGVWGCLRRN